jgi:excisionase family DNA binding protein
MSDEYQPYDTSEPRLEASSEMPCSPGLLTVTEVAQLLRVSKMTVYRLIHSRALPTVSIRGTYRIRASALVKLLDLGSESDDEAEDRAAERSRVLRSSAASRNAG